MGTKEDRHFPAYLVKNIYLLLVLLVLFLPQAGMAASADKPVGATSNPGSELWREVRQRDMDTRGTTQVQGVDSNVLINVQGYRWTLFRTNELVSYGSIALVVVAGLILLFYLMRGKIELEAGLSGRMVHRFTDYERIVHWTLALVFLFLALTGLILLFGRDILIPLFGKEFFSVLASASKEGHNLFGPIFIVSLLMMLASFVRRNLYQSGDLSWLLKGGGFIGKAHVSGGFFNMGEKSWYWLVILVGLVISLSGLILVSPGLGQGRVLMELSHVVHSSAALILIAISFGHMYMGSKGTQGSLEAMKSGYVDINWAEAHHDRWAKECHDNNLVISADSFARLQGRPIDDAEAMSSPTKEQRA